MQGAESVKKLPHLRDLVLADENFHSPGRIDLLLGQNIWKQLFLPGQVTGPEDQPDAWLTVFGWTIMGNYNPNITSKSPPAMVPPLKLPRRQMNC